MLTPDSYPVLHNIPSLTPQRSAVLFSLPAHFAAATVSSVCTYAALSSTNLSLRTIICVHKAKHSTCSQLTWRRRQAAEHVSCCGSCNHC